MHDIDNDDEFISKTQRKKECDELQKLGEELTTLKDNELDSFDLPDELYTAIINSRKIRQRGALKRHRQYIGRLMRDIDAEPIAQQLLKIRHKDDVNNAAFKRIEKWRDQLITEGDKAIDEIIKELPEADRQYLRQLSRNAIKEQQQDKPPVAYRKIFKYLRELSE
ncbi:MAG: DUF615 domain-containing protein [Gammaproteobacteria bacterium]|nr:DUF615 domain-containing protein [Gammaproteobacteria bacterium]